MELNILLIVKIILTILSVAALSVVAGMVLSAKIVAVAFPTPKITVLGDILPFHAILNNIVLGKDGVCSQILSIAGSDAGAKTSAEIASLIQKKQYWLDKMVELKATFKILTIRREYQHDLASGDVSLVLKKIHQAWMNNFKTTYQNTHYLIISVYPNQGNRLYKFLKQDLPAANTGLLKEIVTFTIDCLVDFKPKLLTNGYHALDDELSDLMSLLHELGTGETEPLMAKTEQVQYFIGNNVKFLKNSDLIEYNNCYGKIISLNKWCNVVSSEMLKEIQALPCKLTILQMFSSDQKTKSLIKLKYQLKQKQMIFKNPHIQADYDTAIEEVQAGRTSMYNYQLSIVVMSKNLDELEHWVSQVKRLLISYGKTPIVEKSAKELVWRCQFPGCDYMIRPAHPMSCNLSYLINFECAPSGLDRCDWGDGAIRPFKTAVGNAYSLQLHVSTSQEALAHALIVAPSNSGKTTLFQHLIGGALRHAKLRAFIFDRLNGTKIFTQAVGGNYVDFNDGSVLLNPLVCAANDNNKAFLQDFLQMLAKTDDDDSIYEAGLAVQQIMSIPIEHRILAKCFLDIARKKSNFAKGLRKWSIDNLLAKWFNGFITDPNGNEIAFDALELNKSRLTAFEMTKIQENSEVAAAVTTYLMHKIRIIGTEAYPHLIFIDETQPMMEDAVFAKHLGVLLKEHRKLRGAVSVCFQDVTMINSVILEQCQTRFLFPNAAASKEQYAKFELTDFEWDYIKGFSPIAKDLKYSVLLKKPSESVILNIDLTPLGNLLQLYRSGSEPVKIVKELQQQWGMTEWVDQYLSLG
jgi:type IV secretion/conjugal transfer VirB4 family ATPase